MSFLVGHKKQAFAQLLRPWDFRSLDSARAYSSYIDLFCYFILAADKRLRDMAINNNESRHEVSTKNATLNCERMHYDASR